MWPNPQFPTDFVTFTKEILNGKLHFLGITSFPKAKGFHVKSLVLFSIICSRVPKFTKELC